MQNSVGHPRYADLVPLCVGEGPSPGCLDPDGAGAQVHVDVQGASHQLQAKIIHLKISLYESFSNAWTSSDFTYKTDQKILLIQYTALYLYVHLLLKWVQSCYFYSFT